MFYKKLYIYLFLAVFLFFFFQKCPLFDIDDQYSTFVITTAVLFLKCILILLLIVYRIRLSFPSVEGWYENWILQSYNIISVYQAEIKPSVPKRNFLFIEKIELNFDKRNSLECSNGKISFEIAFNASRKRALLLMFVLSLIVYNLNILCLQFIYSKISFLWITGEEIEDDLEKRFCNKNKTPVHEQSN